MRVVWRRAPEELTYKRPITDFVCSSVRGGGKSSLLETRAEGYLREGQVVLDLFGSRDSEGLAWLRSPWANMDERTGDLEKNICLIHGDNVDVDCSVHTINVSKLALPDLEKYDILISASGLYSSVDDEFLQVNKITDIIYSREYYKRIVYAIVREASNLFYSRIKVSGSQTQTKGWMIYLLREARHMGLALGLDTLKYTSIDLDIRTIVDYVYIKAMGMEGLPDKLKFLYGYFRPDFVRAVPPNCFIITSQKGGIGLGVFNEIPWHKQEKEDIKKEVGVYVEHGEGDLDYGTNKGKFNTIGDPEHVEIVEAYHYGLEDMKNGKVRTRTIGMHKIGKKLRRSPSSIRNQLIKHDEAVKRTGWCAVCKRAGGRGYMTLIQKTARKPA